MPLFVITTFGQRLFSIDFFWLHAESYHVPSTTLKGVDVHKRHSAVWCVPTIMVFFTRQLADHEETFADFYKTCVALKSLPAPFTFTFSTQTTYIIKYKLVLNFLFYINRNIFVVVIHFTVFHSSLLRLHRII